MDPMEFKPLEPGKRKLILDSIRERIHEADPEGLARVLPSFEWVDKKEAGALAEPLLLMVGEGGPELALVALDGLARLEAPEAEKPLGRLIVEQFKAGDSASAEVRRESIRTLGKLGTVACADFLVEIISSAGPADAHDREAAVEALTSLALRHEDLQVGRKLEGLHGSELGPEVSLAVQEALKELNLRNWEDKGYLTIEADVETGDEQDRR